MNRYAPMLFFLAAVWGASYLFIKVAVEDIEPAPMMAVRTLVAAAVLLVYLAWRLGWTAARADLRAAWRHCLVLGVFNAALPFWLIAWGEKYIDSSLAAVLQASVPIFNALILLRVLPHERLSGTRVAGLAIGIVGVAVVTGIHPDGGSWAIVGALAVVASSLSYASAGVYGQLAVSGTAGPVLATGSMLVGGLILLPFALFQLPTSAPSWEAVSSLLALTLLGTALAQLVLFRILALHGSARLSLVTYLMPGFAIVYGALILDETDLAGDPGRPGPHPRRRRARFRRRAAAAPARRQRTMILRRATAADLGFLIELYADDDVRPFLAGGGRYDADALADELARDPGEGELLVIEVDGAPAGAMRWRLESERNRIAHLGGIAVHPAFRGRRVADDAARLLQSRLIGELGLHRLQLEVYGFNERALRHAERSGFVREGVKRKAYLRDGEWVDSVLYGLVAEDLQPRNESSSAA